VLDHWLKQCAIKNETEGASRTFVVHDNQRVVGYYALATGSVAAHEAPGKIKRNMPNPIPVMVLGRLAVDLAWQKHGIGKGLLKDAVLRTIKVSHSAGIRALLIHAISEPAKHFYKRYGFIESPIDPMTLMMTMRDIKKYLL
ncbi:MAG: GNAT family N-acetyltransferase, partial [Gammaproteobacteria bacterium]|nr:GNAT family N-acetyltransferase [Gammaproteobacteria bacterium]